MFGVSYFWYCNVVSAQKKKNKTFGAAWAVEPHQYGTN